MIDKNEQATAEHLFHAVQNCLEVDPSCLDSLIQQLLRSIRQRLGMDVAFVSEFLPTRRVFRYVDSDQGVDVIQVECSEPLSEGYCKRVVEGALPELVLNARGLPDLDGLNPRYRAEIGVHISVPIRLSDGRIYGTFCTLCESGTDMGEQELAFVRVCADITAALLEARQDVYGQGIARRERIHRLLEDQGLTMVLQPVKSLSRDTWCGYEALTRVIAGDWPPDVLFADATQVGLDSQLGAFTVAFALDLLANLPDDTFIAINVSPRFLLENDIAALLPQSLLPRIVLEITEHAAVSHYGKIANALAPLRAQGLRVAVDDAGAGYASFRHILALRPDIIKLDISLIHNIDRDEEKQALAALLTEFARQRGYQLIAEGVETEAELEVLRAMGVDLIQGYLIERPQPLNYFFPES